MGLSHLVAGVVFLLGRGKGKRPEWGVVRYYIMLNLARGDATALIIPTLLTVWSCPPQHARALSARRDAYNNAPTCPFARMTSGVERKQVYLSLSSNTSLTISSPSMRFSAKSMPVVRGTVRGTVLEAVKSGRALHHYRRMTTGMRCLWNSMTMVRRVYVCQCPTFTLK